jgi:hypothetical protein
MRRLRPLSETECYVRLYGGWDSTVRLVAARQEPPRLLPAGERIRRLFEERLDARPPEAAPEAA